MAKQYGPRNGKWKGGKHINDKGYLRIGTREGRDKYVHRAVIENLLEAPLCAGYVFPVRGKIPPNMTVEHVDHDKRHNCIGNLMLLEKKIHDKLSSWTLRYIYAHWDEYLAKIAEENAKPPEWVTGLDEDGGDANGKLDPVVE